MSFYPPPRPYPPARYTGEGGEITASLRRADTAPELVKASGTVHHLSTGDSTGGDFGLYRWTMDGPPGGPGPHFHRTMSESFYVLAGTMSIYDGTQWVDAHPNDYVHVPAGGVHGFRNATEHAEMLILFAPGGPREGYFEGLASLGLGAERPSPEEMDEFYRAHDNYWV
jgi:mannose-6-phosphate isomerase-like protein (cupin superfamily)